MEIEFGNCLHHCSYDPAAAGRGVLYLHSHSRDSHGDKGPRRKSSYIYRSDGQFADSNDDFDSRSPPGRAAQRNSVVSLLNELG